MSEMVKQDVWEEVPSPFDGIASDDIKIKVEDQKLTILENADPIVQAGFETPITDTLPRIKGKECNLEQAVDHIASAIKESRQTVIGGMATDLNGARAVMALADKSQSTIDHMNSDAGFRNLLVLQDTGWMNTTLTEVRNRVDLLLVVNSDIELAFPRFFERMIWNEESMFNQDISKRQVVYLGKAPSGDASTSPDGKKAQVIACEQDDLPEVLSVLKALINGRQLQAKQVGNIAIEQLETLAEQLKNAKYSVVTWSASMFDFDHAETSIQMICELVKDLNVETRCNGLPLGGKDGDVTAYQVASWQSGYPVRTSFNRGFPDYDPYLNNSQRMLEADEVDLLIWISSFDVSRKPPNTKTPTIVLGRSGMTFDNEPEVFIPVGTPGIDHCGRVFRTDSVVSIPLQKLRDSGLPSTCDVLTAVEKAL